MIQVYADGKLAYNSLMEGFELVSLKTTIGMNTGGTAEIVLPLGHPAYSMFVDYRTIVTIYRDGKLRFRGRALYHADNFYGQRTITCEGEMCLLRDGITRPYLYQDTPANIFTEVIQSYNAQVESFKQFRIGTITVVDANDYVRLESESAETTLDTINKLVERCGGYVVFSEAIPGIRLINWYATLDYQSDQIIEFGENLLDFSRTGANTTNLATGIVPYGAKDEKTKKRLTIESVNGGKDYILAEDAQAVRGTVMATATWDDVTKPENLLKKAQALLEERKTFITSLELTALDLSYMDKRLDSFNVGDKIRVVSAPHGVDALFQLTQMTEDMVNPANSRIILGKDIPSLTSADVAGDFNSQRVIESTVAGLKTDYGMDVDQVASDVEARVLEKTSGIYVRQDAATELLTSLGLQISNEADTRATADQTLQTKIDNEVSARAGVINKVNGVVNISGGAPVKILGGKVEIDGTEIHMGKELRFLNESGIRIADKDGNFYYVLRVDASNNCFVGNDYAELYLRAKTAVYLHKTGATVTSDAREKENIGELPEAYVDMLDKLTPVRFTYKGRDPGKYHVGFTAQDVAAAMESSGLSAGDFGGFVDLKGDGSLLGLVYDEFIGLLLQKLRKQDAALAELKTRINKLEGKT